MNHKLKALDIFELALDLAHSDRHAFIEKACAGDDQLESEVRELLAKEGECGDFLATVAAENDSTRAARTVRRDRLRSGDQLQNRYEIVEQIGVGGMGEVYRARDTRLERDVAIKVLSIASLHNTEMYERFAREMKSVAALSHSSIVTLYDTAQSDGIEFAVMEFVDGRTLRSIIGDGLDWTTSAKLAMGIAEAIQIAHDHNVIHRDIKPDNVMVTADGTVKVLDFGLAKPTDQLSEQQLTGDAATPGTVPYMSPEQTNGAELDSATDIFSLGITLFEMLTGQNPFRAETVFKTMQNINGDTPSIENTISGLPDELVLLVNAMLHRDTNNRPAASEIARSLRQTLDDVDTRTLSSIRLAPSQVPIGADTSISNSTTVQGGRPSIAVLPLQNLSTDPSSQFFGDAIAQDVIVQLTKLHWLLVIARGSSFQFREPDVDLSEVGAVLGVRYLLTGSVQVLGSQGVVSVELLRASDQQVVWAERFQVSNDELLHIRDTITASIVVAIESRIQRSEAETAQRLPTENLDAWLAYHRGLWHMYRFNRDDNVTAVQMFDRAIEADPRFARAYAGLSFTHFQEAFLRYSNDVQTHKDLARSLAEKSIELDPLDPFTNLTMGRSAWLENDLDDAGSWFNRSLELCPNYAFAWYNRALTDVLSNDGEQGEHGASRAMLLSPIDPLGYAMNCTVALSHVVRGEYELAIPWVVKATSQPTAHVHIWLIAAMVHQLAGMKDKASKYAAKLLRVNSKYSQQHFFRAFPFRDPTTQAICKQALDELGV